MKTTYQIRQGNYPYPWTVKGHPLLELIWREIWWKNSNFILVCSGMPGRGKSKLAQYLMWAVDRNPRTERPRASLMNWTTSKSMFAEAVDRCADQVGRAITWEEPNVGGVRSGGTNARRFMSNDNLQVSTLFQTFRTNKHLIILTLPSKKNFDSQAREVAHAAIHVLRNNGEYSTNQLYMLEMNPIFGRTYIKRLKFIRNGRLKTLGFTYSGLPPESFGRLCDEKSDWAKRNWRQQIATTRDVPVEHRAVGLSPKVKFETQILPRLHEYTYSKKTRYGMRDMVDVTRISRELDVLPTSVYGYLRTYGIRKIN